MWNDFFLDANANLKDREIFPVEPVSSSEVGNLSLVAGQKYTLQGMLGRTNFRPTVPFPFLFMMLSKLKNLWNYNQINS